MPRVLVTGASGFVGVHACQTFISQGWQVRAVSRQNNVAVDSGFEWCVIPEVDEETDWRYLLKDVDCIVHLAGIAHQVKRRHYTFHDFERVNTQGTQRLAQQAISAGVKRFVFVSSVGVHGLQSPEGRCLTENDSVKPHDAYTQSKINAENALAELGKSARLEIVVVRPCLVYGPGAPGNFYRLIQLVRKGIPLPFASVKNRRSLLYVQNLADALVTCARHPNAAGHTYLVADKENLSITEVIRVLSLGLGRVVRLFSVPTSILRLLGLLVGRKSDMDRLIGSLCVDTYKIQTHLGWQPRFSTDEGLMATAAWYRVNS